MTSIAVIGAGFSGTLLALHLLRRCPASTRVTLIERGRRFGCGTAYSTGNPSHLLNVPAGRMSAFHHRPNDFLDWLADQPGADAGHGSFVSRGTFGAYVRDLLKAELRLPENHGRLRLVRGEVERLEKTERALVLSLDRNRSLAADFVVLAIGQFPPEAPPGTDDAILTSSRYVADPWSPGAFDGLDPEAPVILIGTGLTMIDVAISLADHGHRGAIHAVSRRGLLARRHDDASAETPENEPVCPTRLVPLMRSLRDAARRAEADGSSWQKVIDQLRPFTADVWQAFSPADRARFLRHARPWWEVHRHRMAPEVAERLDALSDTGQLTVHAGRIRQVVPASEGLRLTFAKRRVGGEVTLAAARLINCSGPTCDFERVGDPLIRSLLGGGLVRPEANRLGIDVTANCAVLDAAGAISRRVFAVGPLTKGAFWEMTAVPDLRRQCEGLAVYLAGLAAHAPRRRSHAPPELAIAE